jgi:EAL domain-containing protein (putative c-di-GMP-specific phosphodiesterase class I)
MIYVALQDLQLSSEIVKSLSRVKHPVKVFDLKKDETLVKLLNQSGKGPNILITEINNDKMDLSVWGNILYEISHRTVLIICNKSKSLSSGIIPWAYELDCSNNVSLKKVSAICSKILGQKDIQKPSKFFIPFFSDDIAIRWLKREGALSIVSVHTDNFESIGIDYGVNTMDKLNLFFSKTLYNLWGLPGSFRKTDYLCRPHNNSSTYYILLTPPRHGLLPIPEPGHLDLFIRRLQTRIEGVILKELINNNSQRTISKSLTEVPDFSIGYATVIDNVANKPKKSVYDLLERSRKNSYILHKKYVNGQQELLQYLMCSKNLLKPYYQGIFRVKNITKDLFTKVEKSKSIYLLKSHIYGFESLIRNNVNISNSIVKTKLENYIDLSCISPDVLFHLAEKTNVEMELDQHCLEKSMSGFKDLPGFLFTNVLPRNYYHLVRLIPKIENNIVFEISEKEVINNYSLLQDIRKQLEKKNHRIAIDDFGKGFADLEKVLLVKPDIIKLDRSLIKNIDKDLHKKNYLTALSEAAKLSNSLTLAEGVETYGEFKVIKRLGIDLVQGFSLHHPQDEKDILKSLKKGNKK